MSFDMLVVTLILVLTLILLVTEWLRVDLLALFVLSALALTGVVSSEKLFFGFSNHAVITIWAMYILSDGLVRTGSTEPISRMIIRLSGNIESRAIIVIMLTSGFLSAFMNNIGVAALMLPVVVEFTRRTEILPSRLLMPLAFGCLLGGLITMIGTPPNLLVSEFMHHQGLNSFGMFDYAPVGILVLILGTLFMAFIGRHLLPNNPPILDTSYHTQKELVSQYGLQERTFVMSLKPGSVLVGKRLQETQLNTAAGLIVVCLIRNGQANFQPMGTTILGANDRLMVQGKLERFNAFKAWSELIIERESTVLNELVNEKVSLSEIEISRDSLLIDNTLDYHTLYRRFGVNVLAIRRASMLRRTKLSSLHLRAGDKLLIQGDIEAIESLSRSSEFVNLQPLSQNQMEEIYHLKERLFVLRIPADSAIAGQSLGSSRIGDAFDFRILGIFRDGNIELMPAPDYELADRDLLLVQGLPQHLEVLRGLQELKIENSTANPVQIVNSDEIALMELALAPRSDYAGQLVADIEFKEKYGVQLLAIWCKNEVHRTDFNDVELQNGDAVVVMGTKEKLKILYEDKNFIPLTKIAFEDFDSSKAKIATSIMALVVIFGISGYVPFSICALFGAALMVATNCLTMDNAYKSIDWRVVFLIAGMLPLGSALQETGLTDVLAQQLTTVSNSLGFYGILFSLFFLTSIMTLFIPTAALVVVIAPIAYDLALKLGLSPEPLIMTVAVAASASLASPIAHPANILVMVPGGYRFIDYVKVGFPLTFLVFLIAAIIIPLIWPGHPTI